MTVISFSTEFCFALILSVRSNGFFCEVFCGAVNHKSHTERWPKAKVLSLTANSSTLLMLIL